MRGHSLIESAISSKGAYALQDLTADHYLLQKKPTG
jgi:hypothetical protein